MNKGNFKGKTSSKALSCFIMLFIIRTVFIIREAIIDIIIHRFLEVQLTSTLISHYCQL